MNAEEKGHGCDGECTECRECAHEGCQKIRPDESTEKEPKMGEFF